MARCTIPQWLGFGAWWDKHFLDLCNQHDANYVIGCPFMKIYSDFWLCWKMTQRGYWWVGLPVLPILLTLGWLFWALHRFDDLRRFCWPKIKLIFISISGRVSKLIKRVL